MKDIELKTEELKELINETVNLLGSTNQTYTKIIQFLQSLGVLSQPKQILNGQLLFFKYHPINEAFIKTSNPYDQYPLIFVTEVHRGGFQGINLHYLSPQHRKILFDLLIKNIPIIKGGEIRSNRIKTNYDVLSSKKILRLFKPCYRQYRWEGLLKRPTVIPFQFWETLIESNTQRFVLGKKEQIHRQSYIIAMRRKGRK